MTDWNGDETDHFEGVDSGGSSTADPPFSRWNRELFFDLLWWWR